MSRSNRIPGADELPAAKAKQALKLMRQALELLDMDQGPLDVSAHLDLAIHLLQEAIAENDDETR